MKLLFEGESYSTGFLNETFDTPSFYNESGENGIITHVGYYHSLRTREIVYMLPKVFLNSEQKFGIYNTNNLIQEGLSQSFTHGADFQWVRQLMVFFYNSLSTYKKRCGTSLLNKNESFEVNSNLGKTEYSFLDLLLTFVNFYKKNKQLILFHHKEYISNQAKKPKWEKTIRKTLPFLNTNNSPVYFEIRNKKKVINNEEELLIYFFSILNQFNLEHSLGLKIDKNYKIISGKAFESLEKNGLRKLSKIKHRYFSDTLKRMYQLCYLYFSHSNTTSKKRRTSEYISVRNYNLIFEDMVDRLFSDKLESNIKVDDYSLNDLKYNKDGKIIDHIYEAPSLIDTSNIFYIGDSKYYKSDTQAGSLSTYKQFTYAKNVIQFNIDLLNKNKFYHEKIRYRDEITEGYNISPNFFIYGYIEELTIFSDSKLARYGLTKKLFHFPNRLFDRDTLFILQYQINFLYVLKAYSTVNSLDITKFRQEAKEKFRDEFIKYFGENGQSEFKLFEKELNEEDAKQFVEVNFKKLNGKCFWTYDNKLLIAKHNEDTSFEEALLEGFLPKVLC